MGRIKPEDKLYDRVLKHEEQTQGQKVQLRRGQAFLVDGHEVVFIVYEVNHDGWHGTGRPNALMRELRFAIEVDGKPHTGGIAATEWV